MDFLRKAQAHRIQEKETKEKALKLLTSGKIKAKEALEIGRTLWTLRNTYDADEEQYITIALLNVIGEKGIPFKVKQILVILVYLVTERMKVIVIQKALGKLGVQGGPDWCAHIPLILWLTSTSGNYTGEPHKALIPSTIYLLQSTSPSSTNSSSSSSSGTQADYITISSCLPTIAHTARGYPMIFNQNSRAFRITVESNMMQYLSNASTLSENKKKGLFQSTDRTLVTEADGTPTRDFFTVLNSASTYSSDQIHNIFSFSMIYNWLLTFYSPPSLRSSMQLTPLKSPFEELLQDNNSPQQQQQQDWLSGDFQDSILSYCLRILEQSKLKWPGDIIFSPSGPPGAGSTGNTSSNSSSGASSGHPSGSHLDQEATLELKGWGVGGIRLGGGSGVGIIGRMGLNPYVGDVALIEATRILDLLSLKDKFLVQRLFPSLKKTFDRMSSDMDITATSIMAMLSLLQYFVNHSEHVAYHPEPLFRSFFLNHLHHQFTNPVIAFETLKFFNDNKLKLLSSTTVFSLYFPPLFKLLAWSPRQCYREMNELLPALIFKENYVEVLGTILDLPVLATVLERVQCEGGGGGIAREDYHYLSTPFRPIFMHFLRNESCGQAIGTQGIQYSSLPLLNLWSLPMNSDSPSPSGPISSSLPSQNPLTTSQRSLLMEFLKYNSNMNNSSNTGSIIWTKRVIACSMIVPKMLEIYFQVILSYSGRHSFTVCRTLFPLVIERLDQLYPYPSFKLAVSQVIVTQVSAILQRWPAFIHMFKEGIVSTIAGSAGGEIKPELILNLCWAIGILEIQIDSYLIIH